MNVAIVGYGRMGKMIHSLIVNSGKHRVTAIIDPYSASPEVTSSSLNRDSLKGSDVAFDFTLPSSALGNASIYASVGMPAVIGTTGWATEDAIDSLKTGKEKIIYSGNFSLGVSVFLKIAEKSAELIGKVGGYDASIIEIHHAMKADSPSGTAKMVAQRVLSGFENKEGVLEGNSRGKIDSGVVQISSIRTGNVPGTHTVIFDGAADTITIEHSARSREGFALGAIAAAEWIVNQKEGIYTMDDYIGGILK